MRSKKHRKATPEEALRQAVEARMEMNFDYGRIQSRIDTDEITRIGAARRAHAATPRPAPARRPVAAVLTATILTATLTLGGGGFLIARLTEEPAPPVIDTHPSAEETTDDFTPHTQPLEDPETEDPAILLRFDPSDTLTRDGVTYTRTNLMVPPTMVGDPLGEVAEEPALDGIDVPDRLWEELITASRLESGAVLYEVAEHSTALYLAVETIEGCYLYMVQGAETPDLP